MSKISEADIQGYIDRAVDPETSVRVEGYLANRPEEFSRVRETREDMALLRRAFTVLEAQIPDRHIGDTVRLVLEHTPRRGAAGTPLRLRIAAMVAFLFVGSVAVFGIKVSMTVPAYADAAALAYLHLAKSHADAEEGLATDPRGLIEWLNERTGLLIRVPFAEEHGFNLIDGQLTSFDRHAAGVLVYEDWRRHRVVIFVTRVSEKDEPKPHFARAHSIHIDYWSHSGVGVVIAAADKRDLEEFTLATQRAIDVSAVASIIGPR